MGLVTLTFDNGPDAEVTPAVLDVLARHSVLATFFVIGEKLAEPGGRAAAQRAHDEGHFIGNHTWSHSVPLGDAGGEGVVEAEIGRTQRALGSLAHPDRLFRPYAGGAILDGRVFSPQAYDYLRRGGFTCVLWNAVPRDWEDEAGWVDTALAQCEALAHALLVLHDFLPSAPDNVERLLVELRRAGHDIVQRLPEDCLPLVRGEVRRATPELIRAGP